MATAEPVSKGLFATNVSYYKLITRNIPFAFSCSDGESRWVANMFYENFERLRDGGLKFPVAIRETKDGRAEIIDPRIKSKWIQSNPN
jgi:hypothetical protein